MLKKLLNKLLPGVKSFECEKLPSYSARDAANLKQRDKFSPMALKYEKNDLVLNITDGMMFNSSIMDSRTLPSRLKYGKGRTK